MGKRSISVIGSGSTARSCERYELAEEMGKALVDAGFRVVCGGMGGVMEAVCRGAKDSGRYSEGDVLAILPVGNKDVANTFVDVAIPTPLGHMRNAVVAHSDAVIAIGGGAGTLCELAFAWIYDRRILAFRVEGWSGKVADTRLDARERFFGEEDDQVVGVDTVAQAMDRLRAWFPRDG